MHDSSHLCHTNILPQHLALAEKYLEDKNKEDRAWGCGEGGMEITSSVLNEWISWYAGDIQIRMTSDNFCISL